jgi:hypothetical protein
MNERREEQGHSGEKRLYDQGSRIAVHTVLVRPEGVRL